MNPALDGPTRYLLARMQRTGDPEATVGLLLRLAGPVADEQRSRLQAAGARIRSVAGDVLTADVPAGRVEAVARLDFVTGVSAAQPLFPEPTGLARTDAE